jgi:potassium-dependent mechanosensitive channel
MIRRLVTALLFAFAAALPPLHAQDPQQPNPPAQATETSAAALQARLEALNADTAISAEQKAPIAEALGRAIESAKAAELAAQNLQRYTSARGTVAARLATRATELQALEAKKPGPQSAELKLSELEQGLVAAQQAQADAQKLASDLDKEAARRAERRNSIPTLTGDLKKRLDELPAQPADAADADPRLVTAHRLALQTERLRLQAEIDALAGELQTYDAETELARAERDLAARRATAAKADVDAWLAKLQPLRAAEAKRAEAEAQLAAAMADERVKKLASGNAELAAAAAKLAAQRAQVEDEKSQRDAERLRLQQDFEEVKKRAVLVGSTDAVGTLLRQRRTQLTDTNRLYQQRSRSRHDRIADAQLQSLEFDERRRRLVEDPEAWLQQQLDGPEAFAKLPAAVIEQARKLRDARRDLLTQLTEGYSALLNTSLDVDSTERQLGELIKTYRSYVTERVLGIRSSKPIWQLDWRATGQAMAWLGNAKSWAETGRLWLVAMLDDGWPFALLVPLLLLIGLRRPLQKRLVANGVLATRGTNVSYAPTARAAIDTALLAAPWPLLLWFLSWRIAVGADSTDFGKAMAAGAAQAAASLLLVTSLRALLQPKGLAESHFRWQTTTVSTLRSVMPALLLALLPFPFALGALELPGEDGWLGSLGGLLLIGQLGLLSYAFWRMLHPSHGILGAGVSTATTALYRFRKLWFLFAFGTPITLLLMVALGYEYTALQLARRLQLTVGVLLLGVFVHAMIVRGLVLERRRLQMRRAQERLQAAKSGDAVGATPDVPVAPEVDPQSLARQTQTLLHGAVTIAVVIASFQVWVDVLPALGILRRVELWNGGTDTLPSFVTLADVLLSLFVLIASSVAARNLPALLELLVLQRLSMQAGERHAITTLARYGIVIVGIVLAFSSIGIGWAKVQWLVAAVSVGLGFGLQEVFANFVSGLILLFEQPIRVGDLVTVGTVHGRVNRIRIRATTIQDFDRKELVVPNREFVTSQFVNWTLTDSVVRWTIPVGVAYGSDTDLALSLLEQVARASKYVVDEPAPEAVFVGFADSSLDIQLRLFVDMNSLEYRWMTELHQAIDKKFREAGIEIAFPQRDVNLHLPESYLELLRAREGLPPTAAAPKSVPPKAGPKG